MTIESAYDTISDSPEIPGGGGNPHWAWVPAPPLWPPRHGAHPSGTSLSSRMLPLTTAHVCLNGSLCSLRSWLSPVHGRTWLCPPLPCTLTAGTAWVDGGVVWPRAWGAGETELNLRFAGFSSSRFVLETSLRPSLASEVAVCPAKMFLAAYCFASKESSNKTKL